MGHRSTDKRYAGDNRLMTPKSPYRRRRLAPRCRLITSWGWRRSQGLSCSLIKVALKLPTPTTDRDRTVSRRSEPNSRTALTGEQPDPWDLLQPQDAMSRHRGAKPCRRYELLGRISLLSLAYLLSVERWQFHVQPPDHLDLLSYLLDVCVSQLSWLISIYSTPDCQPG